MKRITHIVNESTKPVPEWTVFEVREESEELKEARERLKRYRQEVKSTRKMSSKDPWY